MWLYLSCVFDVKTIFFKSLFLPLTEKMSKQIVRLKVCSSGGDQFTIYKYFVKRVNILNYLLVCSQTNPAHYKIMLTFHAFKYFVM